MYRTLSGKEPAEAILLKVKRRAGEIDWTPTLAIVLVGADKASQIYVESKIKKAAGCGIKAILHKLPETVSESEILALVDRLNEDGGVDGFIVQSPLPKHIDEMKIVKGINPAKDVDGWTPVSMGNMFVGTDSFLPATPAGVMRLLEYYNVPIEGRHAVVVGRSNVVGKPLAILLLRKNATVTICHSKTKNLAEYTKSADILIAAVGMPGLIKADMVKKGAVVIDVGITRIGEIIKGDVEFDEVLKKADCTPVPGGVGLMTVAMLLENVVLAAERKAKK
ncbi:bifunctional 5,10-methylenetetrahydrofolate dehydrogenase/5,10-methenyltetrahydrofolate cyclohydrolase [Candidatus Micrarchaeota archaeon]|nr:bifunctional 5,10-methylenetetrahydrofolate dehydrogenase/5,10-methenyltetrahydrofolate cyclohydrolase [Candidatus Micrarchaeota archaeon]